MPFNGHMKQSFIIRSLINDFFGIKSFASKSLQHNMLLYRSTMYRTVCSIKMFDRTMFIFQGKGKRKEADSWPSISEPLNCLDVFAGCGG